MPGQYLNDMAITITLLPKFYKKTCEEQWSFLFQDIENLRSKYLFQISLTCEFTQDMQIHLHGFISLNRLNSNNKTLRMQIKEIFAHAKVCGRIYVREIDNHDKWLTYCLKNRTETEKDLLGVIMFDEHQYFNPDFWLNLDQNFDNYDGQDKCTCPAGH